MYNHKLYKKYNIQRSHNNTINTQNSNQPGYGIINFTHNFDLSNSYNKNKNNSKLRHTTQPYQYSINKSNYQYRIQQQPKQYQTKQSKQIDRKKQSNKNHNNRDFLSNYRLKSYTDLNYARKEALETNSPQKQYGKINQDCNQSTTTKWQNNNNYYLLEPKSAQLTFLRKKQYFTPNNEKKEIDNNLFVKNYSNNAKILQNSPTLPFIKKLQSQTYESKININNNNNNNNLPIFIRKRQQNSKYCTPTINDFDLGQLIGKGRFGKVFFAIHRKTGMNFALKQISKQILKKNKLQEQFTMQIKIQLYFNHCNLLKMYGYFTDQLYIYLILQYMQQGSLYQQIKNHGQLSQQCTSKILRDVLEGMLYLHSNNLAHRDIKPQNIVISNGVYKLCDFGWVAICEDRRKTMCGTIDYSAPQILQGKQYELTIDLWCLGVLTYQLLQGKAPFYHLSRRKTCQKIINVENEGIIFTKQLSNNCKDFITKLLIKNPQNRMTVTESLQHAFIQQYLDQDCQSFRKQ